MFLSNILNTGPLIAAAVTLLFAAICYGIAALKGQAFASSRYFDGGVSEPHATRLADKYALEYSAVQVLTTLYKSRGVINESLLLTYVYCIRVGALMCTCMVGYYFWMRSRLLSWARSDSSPVQREKEKGTGPRHLFFFH